MTAEQLAELKAAWPGEWRKDPTDTGYVLDIDQRNTVLAFVGFDGHPAAWTDAGWREFIRSDRGAKTFTEAVASFRAEAREVAAPYLALCGDAP